MKIVVLVKEVPDTYGDRKLSLETGLADRGASETVLDEIGERSLEVALSYADKHPDAEVVVMSMSPEGSAATVRKGLAMGAASAVHIADEGLVGADLGLTAEVLAAALQRTGFDLVIAGNLSTDGSGGVLPAMVAELLDVPARDVAELGRDRRRRGVGRAGVGWRDDAGVGGAARGDLDHRAAAGCPVPELQGHHGGEEEAVRDADARRPRGRARGSLGVAVDRDRADARSRRARRA